MSAIHCLPWLRIPRPERSPLTSAQRRWPMRLSTAEVVFSPTHTPRNDSAEGRLLSGLRSRADHRGRRSPEKLFVDNYLYFSSFSDHLLPAQLLGSRCMNLIQTRGLGPDSLVVELAEEKRTPLLARNFVEAGVPVVGLTPAPDQAEAANANGVPTCAEFLRARRRHATAHSGKAADVIIANNVMAHIPDPKTFVAGMAHLLADDGLITVENPSVADLLVECVGLRHRLSRALLLPHVRQGTPVERHGLHLNHVEYFPDLHGGTNRWHIGHHDCRQARRRAQADEFALYANFGEQVDSFAATCGGYFERAQGRGEDDRRLRCGRQGRNDVERHRHRHRPGRLRGRSQHPQTWIAHARHSPADIGRLCLTSENPPDAVLILAWTIAQQADDAANGGKFIVPFPTPHIV